MTTQKTLKAAMIGMRHPHVGDFGPEMTGYIYNFNHLDGVEVVAYCEDAEPSLLEPAKKYQPGARLYTSVDRLIADEEFDLACVALPPNEVPGTCIKLADSGKHFYMEKQYARRSEDLAELVRAVRRNRVKVMHGYLYRYNPVAQHLKRLIGDGLLGKPLAVESRLATYQVRPGYRDPENYLYRNETEGGGILHMLGGQPLELMRFLMGCEVKAVQAMVGRPVGYIEEPLEDVAMVAFEFENGAFGTMHAGYLHPRLAGGYTLPMVYRGLDGWADWSDLDDATPTLKVRSISPDWSGAPERVFKYDFPSSPGYGDRWVEDWLQGFVRDIQQDREPTMTIDDALHTLQCIDAAYESARTGTRVEVSYGL